MSYQKYDKKSKVIYWDTRLNKQVVQKTNDTITFRSLLEFEVFTWLKTLIGCEVVCQVPIKGESLLWTVDFMLRDIDPLGKKVLYKFRDLLNMKGTGSVYIEAKGVITKEFAEKLKLCSVECPSVYKSLVAFGDTPFGIVLEEGYKVSCFPIMSVGLLQKLVLDCNNSLVNGGR